MFSFNVGLLYVVQFVIREGEVKETEAVFATQHVTEVVNKKRRLTEESFPVPV